MARPSFSSGPVLIRYPTPDALEGEALNPLGVIDLSQPGRQFRIRDGTRESVFTAPPDSSVVGYLLAAPGRDYRALYRVQFTDALLDAVGAFLEIDASGAVR